MDTEENISYISNDVPDGKFDKCLQNELSLQSVAYNEEEKRLSTFHNWPAHYPVNPSRLAKSGFYYTGNGDEVVCFSCGGHISDWQYGDIVQKKHIEMYPYCDFVNHKSNNVPLVNANVCSYTECISSHSLNSVINSDKTTNLRNPLECDAKNCNSANCKVVCINSDNVHNTSADSKLHSHIQKPPIEFHKMISLEERLKTFSFGWPLSFPNVSDIAAAGFFYLGDGDKVQCAFCRGVVKNWDSKDVPFVEHVRHFPNCEYVQQFQKQHTQNITAVSLKGQDVCGSSDALFQPASPSVHKLIDKDQQHTKLNELGINLHSAPVHPEQATLAARLQTFLTWPDTVPVKKEDLAAAGFFYIGVGDQTKCFYCDGGLCSWEPHDDPWVEHARWFRNCSFVRLNKGDDFVKHCIEKPDSLSSFNETEETKKRTLSNCGNYFDNALICKVEEAMQSSLISAVLKTNVYPPYLVRAAVFQQIKDSGVPFANVEEVCGAVNALKEKISSNISIGGSASSHEASASNVVLRCGSGISSATENKDKTKYLISEIENPFKAQQETEDSKLMEENRFLRDQRLCKVCMDNDVSVVFLPCGHLLACTFCAPALNDCPLCRKSIQATVRAYLP